MPKWLHDKLAKTARRKGLSGDRFKAYVFGTLKKHEERIRHHLRKKKKGRRSKKVAKP